MKVYYITMVFPSATETFACNDVLALAGLGAEVSVHSLRFARPDTGKMVVERGLAGLPMTYNCLLNTSRGIFAAVARPRLCLRLAGWIFRNLRGRPDHLAKSLLFLPRVMQLFTEIEKNRPGVVHLFWGHYPSMLGFLVGRELPEIVLSVSLGAYDLGMGYGGSIPVLKSAGLAVTFAKANLNALLQAGADPEKTRVVYRGIDAGKYERWTADVPRIPGKISFAGRLMRRKRPDNVLRVFAHVRRVMPGSSLTVMGDGPVSGELEALADSLGLRGRVSFPGRVPHRTVLRELKSSEVFLFMSEYENERLPNAVKEAMFCGCYVVAARSPGIEELIPGEEYGLVIEPGDVEGAARAVCDYLDRGDPGLPGRAHDYIVRHFDVRREMRRLKENWEKLIEEKTG